eukprot:9794638-Alexandrium_andersonii.AAC.1
MADADRRAAISARLKGSSKPKILGYGGQAKTLCCPLDYAGELRLSGAQRNGLLNHGPTLDGMCATHAHPSARRAPRTQAPCEVCVNVNAEAGPFVLPREVVDAAGARDQ